MKSILNLFKAVLYNPNKINTNKYYAETIKYGFILSDKAAESLGEADVKKIMQEFITGEQINNSFHKSWNKVATASDEQLFLEQMLHYITTYGFEALGVYDESTVYIPKEKLELPLLKDDIKLTVINAYTEEELKDKLMVLLESGIALKESTMEDIVAVTKMLELTSDDIEKIKNKEVKVRLFDEFQLVPANPVEFLRYVIYKTTGKTLLIKNPGTIEAIKENKSIGKIYFAIYVKMHGYSRLGEIFLRFKPLFLAFKGDSTINTIINKIRKEAITKHKPMQEDFLNSITAKLRRGESIDVFRLTNAFGDVNIFRCIRLLYAIKSASKDSNANLYKIRNGKSWAARKKSIAQYPEGLIEFITKYIASEVSKNVKGKTIYMPETINYTLPATEKQFIGNMPVGSYVEVDEDMVCGVYWKNLPNYRVDLDLSLLSADIKIGWNASYRNSARDVLFSGDVTDAPKGATELYYIGKTFSGTFLMKNNYYNFSEEHPVPVKIIIGKKKLDILPSNYMLDPNDVIATLDYTQDVRAMTIGLVAKVEDKLRFYFDSSSLGNSNVSSNNEHNEIAREYMGKTFDKIMLKEVLRLAGARIVHVKDKLINEGEIDIDLSPEALEKDTIIKLLI